MPPRTSAGQTGKIQQIDLVPGRAQKGFQTAFLAEDNRQKRVVAFRCNGPTKSVTITCTSKTGNADWPAQQAGRFGRWHTGHNIPTPRAASNTTIASEIKPWVIIPSFADRDRTAVSVGENAVLVLKARKR